MGAAWAGARCRWRQHLQERECGSLEVLAATGTSCFQALVIRELPQTLIQV